MTVNTAPLPVQGATSECVGAMITVSDAVAGGTWTSNTTSVATIGSTGIISGIAQGSSTISYICPVLVVELV